MKEMNTEKVLDIDEINRRKHNQINKYPVFSDWKN